VKLSSSSSTSPTRPSQGFTLVEVMIASVVLVLAITTAITTLQHGLQAVDTARGYTYASQVMQSELERLRLKSWAQLQALQDARDTSVTSAAVTGAPAATFSCTRTIRDVKTDMKEIVLESNWRGYDGRPHTARFVTRYGRSGLYDYFYTSH
jgi:prepilin-type N-terminal cleavage/methylation domain-containing protein